MTIAPIFVPSQGRAARARGRDRAALARRGQAREHAGVSRGAVDGARALAVRHLRPQLVRNNPTRRDLHDKLEELIADYNEGSHNVQESFNAITKFIEGLTVEEQRHVKEGCSEEELAVFDLLTKPGVELSKSERSAVKGLAKGLLAKLKTSKFTLDWRKQARRRAAVRTTIQDVLEALPEAYSDDLFEDKCERIYEHCYESYAGDGTGKYATGQ